MIVLDASAALELLLNTATGKLIAREITNQGVTLHAPHLIDLEIVHTLRRYVLKGAISEAQAQALINYWLQFDVVCYAHEPFIATIWQYRNNLTVYDAAYVALAKILPATLVTCDATTVASLTPILGLETTREASHLIVYGMPGSGVTY